jgi:hypothetical protein
MDAVNEKRLVFYEINTSIFYLGVDFSKIIGPSRNAADVHFHFHFHFQKLSRHPSQLAFI